MSKTIAISSIIFRNDLYPRISPIPEKIQEYANHIDLLPPIEIDQHNILIDGYHRWKAHLTAEKDEIKCIVTQVESESHLEQLAVERNSAHGLQLTQEEKKSYAIKWWHTSTPDDIITSNLKISHTTFLRWTKNARQQREKEVKRQIFDLWLSCHKETEIAETASMSQPYVNKIAKNIINDQVADDDIFRNFKPFVYTTWNIAKLTNKTKVFGSIPQDIIDNLLYYYTSPFDVVFDPFGGGGSTIDKCIERSRRYYVSDLSPIPAREDIRQWDITAGLPPDLPVPNFVFLDPPYWKQAEGKYSEKDTDLGNVDIELFKTTIGNIARDTKRKWGKNHNGAKLAIITSPFYRSGEYTDLPMICFQAIGKYLSLVERIQVPYSTQIASGAEVQQAKNDKRMLHTIRDLMIFERG